MNEISVEIGKLSDAIASELAKYSQAVADGVKEDAETTMKELVEDTKRDAPVKTGAYKKAISSKTAFENKLEKRKLWYVRGSLSKLTHLLERGHQIRGGGEAAAKPHIFKNAEAAKKRFEERVKKRIDDGH